MEAVVRGGVGPVLEISNRVDGLASRVSTDPFLQAAIYPAAFREVLLRLVDDAVDQESEWFEGWEKFVRKLTSKEVSDLDVIEYDDFIDRAVREFSGMHRFASRAAIHDHEEDRG